EFVASQKKRPQGEGCVLGCLFGPLGVIVEACLPTILPSVRPVPLSPDVVALRHEQQAAKRLAKERATAEKAARRAERDKAYRAMGIEPGPWAWYLALSALQQA